MAKKTTKKPEAKPEAPTASTEAPSKSQFIRDELAKNPNAMFRHVSAAWTAAGNKDQINASLFYVVKYKSSATRGRRERLRQAIRADALSMTASTDANAVYLQIESELDNLVARAPDSKIAEALRNARRRVSAKLV